MTMRSRLLLLPALLLSLTACDGPFEIKSGETPGDPFAGADFGSPDQTRSDLISVEETCQEYCNLQDACDAWDAAECFEDCVAPKLEAYGIAAQPEVTSPVCGEAFASAMGCFADASCDDFKGCDAVLYDYVDCAAG